MKSNCTGGLFHENTLTWVPIDPTSGPDPGVDYVVTDGVDPVVITTPDLLHFNGFSVQLVTEDHERTVVVEDGDSVDESSLTWIFANGDFSSVDVGGTFVTTGATDPDNNGTWTIASVTNATTVVSVETPGSDETFDSDVTLAVTAASLEGTVAVEVSNDYVPSRLPGMNQTANAGRWSAIPNNTFSPAIAAITAASSQPIQMEPFQFRFARITVTPTGGQGRISVPYCSKGTR